MRIVADESIDKQIVDQLRNDGHEVLYVSELSPGIDDDAVLNRSREAQAVLLTADKDFGELVFRQRQTHCGVVLIRLAGLDSRAKARMVAAAFREHSEELASGFATLSTRLLRVRKQRS